MSGSSGERFGALVAMIARLAAVEPGLERRIEIDGHLHVAAQQRDHHVGRAAERHDDDVDAGHRLEQFGGEILRAADIDGADIERAGFFLRGFEEIAQRLVRRRRIDHEIEVKVPMIEIGTNCLSGSNGRWLNSGTLIAVPLVSSVSV